MIDRIKNFLGLYDWILVETRMAAYTKMHGSQGGVSQEFIFYLIYYNPKLGRYKLEYEGSNAEAHVMYGEMLKRLASYNMGTQHIEENKDYKGEIVITSIPLVNSAEDVFKFVRDDADLISAINIFKRGLVLGGAEIYKQDKNILATDKGYFASFYESDLDPSITGKNNSINEEDKDEDE